MAGTEINIIMFAKNGGYDDMPQFFVGVETSVLYEVFIVFGIFHRFFGANCRSRSGLEARPVPRYGSASREPCGTWADLGRVVFGTAPG